MWLVRPNQPSPKFTKRTRGGAEEEEEKEEEEREEEEQLPKMLELCGKVWMKISDSP